jgi:polysaccharide pyruvyl transferase WcaK-like protein
MLKIIQIGAKVGDGNRVGKGNSGDTAIGSAFEYIFKKKFPKNIVHFINCRKKFTQNDIDFINKHDLLVVSGGGLFLHDTFKNNQSDWQWGISKNLIKKIHIPVIFYAVGYNKFRGQREFKPIFNDTINELIKKSIFFGLRNTGSCNSLKNHTENSSHKKIKLNFCPTLILNEDFKINTVKEHSVGFVIAGDRLQYRHKNIKKFIEQIKKFVIYLQSKEIKTILISHQNDTWIQDFIKFDKFIDLYKKNSKYIYKTYAKIDLIVSDRGHAQMIPFSLGCKILTPISHNKLRWFLEDVGLSEYGVEEYDPNLSTKLIKKYEKLQKIDWKKIHQKKMEKIFKTNNTNFKLINSQLKSLNKKNYS